MNAAHAVVYVVDDDPSMLKGLSRLLTAAGLGVAAFDSPRGFLERYDPDVPGCIVLDLAMPEMNGLDLQQELAKQGSVLPIIFLTGRGDIPLSVEAMKRGAVDFLTKPVDDRELLAAIHLAFEKDAALRQEFAERAAIERLLSTLTPREREVMLHVAAGHLNKQIAVSLGTVEKTIKVHRARVMRKLRVQSLAELVRLVERAGIMPPSSQI